MVTDAHRGVRGIGLSLVVLMALGACSDDGNGPAGTPTSPVATTTTAPSGNAAVSCEERSAELAAVGDVDAAARGEADLDGDGSDDDVTLHSREGGFRLRAELATVSLDVPLPIEDRSAQPRVLGGHDIDGNGAEELFFEAGRGAAASVVGLATLTEDCELTSVRGPDGSLVRFPVGASAATQQGLECRDGELAALTAETTDGETYEWSEVVMELEGAALTEVDTHEGTSRSPGDAEEIRRFGTLSCGRVTL